MHYPESPKVTPRQPTIYQGAKNYIKFVYGGKKFLKLSIEFQLIKPWQNWRQFKKFYKLNPSTCTSPA